MVAQKTHIVSGRLGYEAQLVNAVLQNSGAIRGMPRYEYSGDGNDLKCRVGCVPRGETEVRWGEWLSIGAVTTKNSPLWKTSPKQQMGYLQVKNWARAFAPGAILGVYTTDELGDAEPMPQRPAQAAEQRGDARPELPAYAGADCKNLRRGQPVADGRRAMTCWRRRHAPRSEKQKAQILSR